MTTIEVNDLYISYGEKIAVGGISFTANSGEVLTILGPNGAGKTSTVEALEGYKKPSKGTIRILGLDPHKDLPKLTPSIGVMLQNGGIYPRMTPIQALNLFHGYYRDPLPVEELIETMNLKSALKTPYRRLSGGEKQRLSLALAIIGKPKVVFLDEPTAGVDPEGRLAIREVIRNLRSNGACVLLTTHELDEAQRLSDRLIILDSGNIVAEGSLAELIGTTQGEDLRFSAPSGIDTNELQKAIGAEISEERAGEYLIASPATPQLIAKLTSYMASKNITVGDIRAGKASLEDVFFKLTGKSIPQQTDTADHTSRQSRRRRTR